MEIIIISKLKKWKKNLGKKIVYFFNVETDPLGYGKGQQPLRKIKIQSNV